MLLTSIKFIITFSTLLGLNKKFNENILATYRTNKNEPKISFINYNRIAVIVLLLIVLVSGPVFVLPEIAKGWSIYNDLFQVTQVILAIVFIIVQILNRISTVSG